jgi:hypothetical protein
LFGGVGLGRVLLNGLRGFGGGGGGRFTFSFRWLVP